MILNSSFHLPVLLPEVIKALNIIKGNIYIDATLGGGGHSEEIIKNGGNVLAIDKDQGAINFVKSAWRNNTRLRTVEGNFKDITNIAQKNGLQNVDGILFDLGLSSFQIDGSGRGFSYLRDERLDMRMSMEDKVDAEDIINKYSIEQLYEIFSKYSEEINSRAIASAIISARSIKINIKRTKDIVGIVESVLNKIYLRLPNRDYNQIRNSTLSRIFQAIRIEVNSELSNLEIGIKQAINLLKSNGRLVVISYHSLEDRIIKLTFEHYQSRGVISTLSKKPIRPKYDEIISNPRSRSAKLRFIRKI